MDSKEVSPVTKKKPGGFLQNRLIPFFYTCFTTLRGAVILMHWSSLSLGSNMILVVSAPDWLINV